MQQKKKICISCKTEQFYWKGKQCKNCYYKENPIEIKRSVLKKKNNKMNKISNSEKERLAKYYTLRDEYLIAHPLCEVNVENCTFKANECHHPQGRIGDNLYKFISVCRHCHQYTHENYAWSIANGFIKSRISKN